jgi:hypothetical protein
MPSNGLLVLVAGTGAFYIRPVVESSNPSERVGFARQTREELLEQRLTGDTTTATIMLVTIEEAIQELEGQEKHIRFSRLLAICHNFFGKARIAGSHHVFKTPWPGDPRINLQEERGMAKPYQVRQVLRCLHKLKEMRVQ